MTENGTNYLYACVIASMATGIPEDFFTSLPLYELLKLKNAVNDADFSSKGRGKSPAESGNPTILGDRDEP